MMAVTVVTPTRNQAAFLEKTIRSVLDQDYPALEYLVVDGGSTDGTLEILRRYEPRVTWSSEPDAGQSDALNKGFQRAKGEILGWLNSDDLYLPGAIEKASSFLEENPSVAMVYGDAEYIDESGVVLGDYLCTAFDLRELAAHCYICQPAVFLRRQALEAAGWVDPRLHYTMDYDLWIRLGLRYPIQHLPVKLAQYRAHGAAKTFTGRDQMSREGRRIARNHFGYVPQTWCDGVTQFLALNLTSPRGRRHIMEHVAGTAFERWPDGWVGRRFRFTVHPRPGDRLLALHGRHLGSPERLELDVYYDDVLWDQITIRRHGDFMAPIELPEPEGGERITVTLESRRVARLPGELRGVSFLLDDLLISGDRWRRVSGFRPRREALARQPQAAAV